MISSSPQNPADIVLSRADTTPDQVRTAADRAGLAQRGWARSGPAERARILSAAAEVVAAASDELTALTVREVGKPRAEAAAEVSRGVSILRYFAQQVYDPIGASHEAPGTALSYTTRRPRGVAGLITPWNFPIAIPLWKAAPALAFGNAVLLKPAEAATACALRLQELLAEVLPPQLLWVVPGGAQTGQAVLDCADVVSFTGSTAVGRQVVLAAAGRGVEVQAEMGGQNACIVLPDADTEACASMVAQAIAGYAGQKCTATKRVIVVGDGQDFRDALVAAMETLVLGDPAEATVAVGPVIDEGARRRVLDAAESAAAAGARILTGGAAVDHDGWFTLPTLVEGVPASHELQRDELFGPICTLSGAPDLTAAIEQANSVRQGLVAGIYTRDLGAALDAAATLDAGMIKVNAPTTGVDFHLPFGGVKESSFGRREQGKAAIDFFTTPRTVTLATL